MPSSLLFLYSLPVPPKSMASINSVHLNPYLRQCFQRTQLKTSAKDESMRSMLSFSGSQELTYQSSCLFHDLLQQLCFLFPAINLLMPRMAEFFPYTSTHFWAEAVWSTPRGSFSFMLLVTLGVCSDLGHWSSLYVHQLWML